MQDKPFLSIKEQVDLLKSRELAVDENTESILLREGYYSVVNGYKKPFLDIAATRKCGLDRYKSGTSFNDLYALFCFERDLREITFRYLVQVEATLRTICAHVFAQNHSENDAYLIQANYCTEKELLEFGLKDYMDNLLKLQSILYKTLSQSKNEPIVHYRKRGNVPIWVLSKALTFGAIEHFFHLMKPNEKREVCKKIAEATGHIGDGHKYFDPKQARLALDPIVKFRNICAHDERLYCAKVGRRNPIIDYAALLELVEPFLTSFDYESLLSEVVLTIVTYDEQSTFALHVLQESGISRLFEHASEVAKKHLKTNLPFAKLSRPKITLNSIFGN